ncbi:ExbD/TolR family protein [Shewanella surugensis]|uniref:Biopolymer transporter ExbD n=1 Tax=Shewanella surugensis TaxID=212020 RepID=A0ABT0L9Y7_9GAMM|nr:biopolymer transporter ExbD [Shewanella surugensis]MCL1124532.1 biopolymer transporter ExbD [Shewanella surugensis]
MINAKGSFSSQVQKDELGVDLTPLIDIIFIVLVFLLLTANAPLLSLTIDVPTAPNASLNPVVVKNKITLNVMTLTPQWAIDGHAYDHWSEFKTAFNIEINRQPHANIIIAADKSAPIQPLMKLLALLQQHEISNTQILMDNSE